MPAPATYPRWSTNGGTTTTPSSGTQNTGFVPGTAAAAKIVNWLLNLIYQWIAWLDAQDIANTAAHGTYNTHFTTLDTQIKQARASRDYTAFTAQRVSVSPGFTPLCIASGGTNAGPIHVVVGASGNWSRSNDKGASWTTAAAAGASNFLACAFHPVNSSFVAAGASGTLYESNNTATSWTARTPAASFSGTFYDACWFAPTNTMVLCGTGGGAGVTQYGTVMTSLTQNSVAGTTALRQLATDGTTIIAVGAAGSDGRIVKSTDGSTWTAAATITGAGTLTQACYHAGLGKWFVASATDIYSSSDLTTWTHVSLVLDSGHVYIGLVALGVTIVAFHFHNSTSSIGCQAKFSYDGATWYPASSFGPTGGVARVKKMYPLSYHANTDVPKHYCIWAGSITGGNWVASQWYAPDGLL